MPFEWPLDKLGIVNSALSQTGDNLVTTADDGSDEWNVASPAYERGLAYLIEQHPWYWTKTTVVLTAAANAPTDTMWDTAYNLPADLVHVILVRIATQVSGPWMSTVWDFQMGPSGAAGPSGMQLVINAQGGPPPPTPPAAPAVVTLQYLSSQSSDPQFATPTFVLALQALVMSGIYRGLHEDSGQADRMWAGGMQIVMDAKIRHDQQRPKRAIFNSRITAARRGRLPWPQVPPGWGGSGSPW
jgi:hypothetical protein